MPEKLRPAALDEGANRAGIREQQDSASYTRPTPSDQEFVARLIIKPKRGKILAHDLTEDEALRLWQQLDEVLPCAEPLVICPSWGEAFVNGEPCFFSQEVRDQYDRDHPLGGSR
jgi:hypothetical protein